MVMNRRQFLKLGASGTAVLFAWTPLFAGPAAPALANLDPRDPDGFSNPLLTPGQEGLLGIFEPQAPFPIQATSAATTILPGKTTGLLVYEVNAGKRFLNPILRVRKGARLTAYLSDGLQAPTTIHWHRLIVNEANDGLPFQAIAPGTKCSPGRGLFLGNRPLGRLRG
jgi:blue copper oxidase